MIFKKKCENSVRINYYWVKYMQMADPFADISSDSEEDDDDGYVDQDHTYTHTHTHSASYCTYIYLGIL